MIGNYLVYNWIIAYLCTIQLMKAVYIVKPFIEYGAFIRNQERHH